MMVSKVNLPGWNPLSNQAEMIYGSIRRFICSFGPGVMFLYHTEHFSMDSKTRQAMRHIFVRERLETWWIVLNLNGFSGWWFHTSISFFISYMGCHSSH